MLAGVSYAQSYAQNLEGLTPLRAGGVVRLVAEKHARQAPEPVSSHAVPLEVSSHAVPLEVGSWDDNVSEHGVPLSATWEKENVQDAHKPTRVFDNEPQPLRVPKVGAV